MKRLEPFWPLVNVSVDIDLTEFGLPDGKQFLRFDFIDPVWACMSACSLQTTCFRDAVGAKSVMCTWI